MYSTGELAGTPNTSVTRRPASRRTLPVPVAPPVAVQNMRKSSGAACRSRTRTWPPPCCSSSRFSGNGAPVLLSSQSCDRSRPSNRPSGSAARLLPFNNRFLSAGSPSKMFAGRVASLLSASSSHSSAISPSKRPAGRVVRRLPLRSSRSNLNIPSKSPFRSVGMRASLRFSVTSAPRCAAVTCSQGTPTSCSMRVCTSGVRPQTSVPWTVRENRIRMVSPSPSRAVQAQMRVGAKAVGVPTMVRVFRLSVSPAGRAGVRV